MVKTHRFIIYIALSGIGLLYLGLSLYQLDLPGLHYDEAFEAVPALQLLRQQPVTPFRESSLDIAGQHFPLMTQDYIGAINTYMTMPFIYFLGPTPDALRLPSVMLGLLTLGLAYVLVHHLTAHPIAGLGTALLLAVDPTFVFWNRQGIFVTAVTATIGLAATLCGLRRLRGGSLRWSLAGAFLFGLGIYAKLLFLWLIGGLIGALLLLNLPRLLRHIAIKLSPPSLSKGGEKSEIPPAGGVGGLKRPTYLWSLRLRLKEALLCSGVFLLGCWPLILYNLQTGGTLRNISQNTQTSYYGVNNLALGPNLIDRGRQFLTLLNGRHLWYLGDVLGSPLPAIIFISTLLLVVAVILTTRRGRQDAETDAISPAQMALFPYLFITVVIIASIKTVSALWITHFALLMPWPAIAITVGVWYSMTQAPSQRSKSWLRLLMGLGLLLLSGNNLINTLSYHRALTESGGLSAHSDAIYDLSDWLAAHPGRAVVAMDWGLAAPIIYLTAGQVTPIEVFGYAWAPDSDLATRLVSFVDQPNTFYLWRAPDEIIFDRSQEFKTFYRPLQLEETIEEAFYERSGRPILGVTRLVTAGTAENPPQ